MSCHVAKRFAQSTTSLQKEGIEAIRQYVEMLQNYEDNRVALTEKLTSLSEMLIPVDWDQSYQAQHKIVNAVRNAAYSIQNLTQLTHILSSNKENLATADEAFSVFEPQQSLNL
jgi:acyl carrier protein phosphodiesterase